MNRLLVSLFAACAAVGSVRAEESPIGEEQVVPASGIRHRIAPLCPPIPGYPVYPDCHPIAPTTPTTPGMTPDPTMPPTVPPPDLSALTTPFATQTAAGGLQGRTFNEAFDGDFAGVSYRKNLYATTFVRQQIGVQQRTVFVRGPNGVLIPQIVTTPVFGNVPVTRLAGTALVPVPGRYSGISITDNDSPRPTDRVYFNYSYYDGINAQLNPGLGNLTMNRPMIGFEKTFLGGDASIGLRLPFVQLNGPPGIDGNTVGDLSVLTKYAFINDPNGGVLSAGLILTTPTAAQGGYLSDGTLVPHSVLFQPWVGFVSVFSRAYVQGITAVIAPTDSRDTSLWTNSLGVGYWLYRADGDRFITGIIPIAEVHIRTPLNNRNINGLVYFQDQVNLTGGLHIRFPRATLGGAVCVPTLAPRPWNVEAIANFSYRF